MSRLACLLIVIATPVVGCAQPTDPLAQAESDSLAALKWVAGAWAGPVVRHYNNGAWRATFEADPASGRFAARYVRVDAPDLTCEGTAAVREVYGPRFILFEQDLTSDACLAFSDGGLIHEFGRFSLSAVQSSPDSAYVQVNYSDGGRLEASGVWMRRED